LRRRKKHIDRLLVKLQNKDPDIRRATVEALERWNWMRLPRPSVRQIDQVFRALHAMLLHDGDPGVRHAVAYAFTFWFESRAPAALISVLENMAEPSRLRGQAAEGIGNVLAQDPVPRMLRSRAIGALERGLGDASAEVRFWCVYALGSMNAKETRARIEHLAATDAAVCPYMWRVDHEAADVLTYWTTGIWPDRDFDPAARLGAGEGLQ